MSKERIGYYPPTGVDGVLIDSLSDLPQNNHWIKDYNEFYRLYEDVDGIRYVYRVKSPKSPLDEELKEPTPHA